MEEKKKRVFIVDGYGQIYRSYFAFMANPLKDKDGNNVSAVFGFFNAVMSLLRQHDPEYLVVAMDSEGKTFRHQMYDQYKANRAKTPEDLHAQVPVIESFLDSMKIPHYNKVGMEADDIIATIARKATEQGIETVMVTGDKDLLQLVRQDVFALRPPRKGEKEYRLCGEAEVMELFGVRPDQIVDYLTILGDSSDNVPGIAGIGEKGAVKLLSEYGSLENAYANIASLTKGMAAKLEAARDHIKLSHDLVMLKDDVFDMSSFDFDNYRTSSIDWNKGIEVFRSIGSEFLVKAARRMAETSSSFSLVADDVKAGVKGEAQTTEAQTTEAQIPEVQASEVPVSEVSEKAMTVSGLADLFSQHGDDELLGIDIETTDEDDMKCALVSIGLSFDGLVCCRVKAEASLYGVLSESLGRFRLVGLNLKRICKILVHHGVTCTLRPYADIMLARWLLNTDLARFEAEDCCQCMCALEGLEKKLKENGLLELFHDIEMPLSAVLSDMEMQGIILDPSRLESFEKDLVQEVRTVENDIYKLCGKTFNINSPKQLQEVLFVDRNLPTGRKTKSGFSTDSEVLEELSMNNEDPVPALILRYRILSKLLGTYVQALPALIDKDTGRIYTTFLQTGTATGRLSSKNPNLQNIPVRTEEGRRIRDAFVPKEGCVLMSADYSQIELVVLAHVSGDSNLRSAFLNGEDVHRETAALVFGVFPEMVTPQQRRAAKTINFGIMYGMSAFRLAHDLGITRNDAQNFIDTYFEQYSGVRDLVEKIKAQAREDGYVRTRMGHIRHVPEMKSASKRALAAAERVAVNTVIQGTAAEIMKKAMISLHDEIERQGLASRMLLQVHDEVIFEVPKDEVERMTELVRTCMEGAAELSVPLRVGIETGSSWGEMH